jgi:hypothetical protein
MPSIGQWLIVKGVAGVTRVMAAFGDEDAKQSIAQLDARKSQLKIMDRVHRYAQSKGISHEQAAKEMGVTLPEWLLESFRMYDPVRWHEEYP